MLSAIDALALKRVGTFELLAHPELDRCQSQRQAICGHRKAGVHENPADCVHPLATDFILMVWADGKPATELASGQIIFESPKTRTSARGVIQPDGTFRINTEGPNDGVMPDVYNIAIVEHRPAAEGATKLPPQHLPDKYYSFTSSGLTATVTNITNETTVTVDRFTGK